VGLSFQQLHHPCVQPGQLTQPDFIIKQIFL
jgi:hypothetical protein